MDHLTGTMYIPSLLCLQGANQWFELQDLHVQELLPQMITLAEAYIQVGCGLHMLYAQKESTLQLLTLFHCMNNAGYHVILFCMR